MNTIIMNTLTGAVSEYTNFEFDSITGTQAGNATGLYTLSGDTDNGVQITSEAVTGKTLWESNRKKRLDAVWFSVRGEGVGELIVRGETEAAEEYRYPFALRPSGQSRAVPGKGIRENYLAFGFSNLSGDAFTLDRIEVGVAQSQNRRV